MKKERIFALLTCAVLLLSSCSDMLGSLDKAAEPETKKEVKAEEPPAQEPVTPGKSDNVSYTVEHWQQNITDDEYTKIENDTQTLSGKIGEKTNAIAKTYTGFTVKAFEQQTLSDNGNIVIKIYYDRKIITYSFDSNGGDWDQKVYKGKYGAWFDASPDDPHTTAPYLGLKTVSNIIYTFAGWDKEVPEAETFGETDMSFTAQWNISKYLYSVEHYLQNLADNNYTQDGEASEYPLAVNIQTSSDIPNDLTKNYAGFDFKQSEIHGGTVIKIYYDRKNTTITFNENGGTFWGGLHGPLTRGYKYESIASIYMGEILWPVREGYEFRGWAYDSNATTCDFPQNLNFEITDSTPSTVTLYAIWKQQNSVNGTISIIPPGYFIIQKSGNSYTAVTSEPGDYAAYGWYLNDISLSSWGSACSVNGRGDSCTIDAAELPVGYYELTFRATGMRTGIEYVSQYENPIFGTKTE